MMRILFLSAGNSAHTHRWVNALSSRGHEVHLLYCKNHAPGPEVSPGVRLHPLPFDAPLGYYLNAPAARRLARSLGCDVCNAHYASGYGTLARLARLRPLVLSVWGSDVYIFPYASGFNMRTLRNNLTYADFVASTGHNMARQVRKLGFALKEEITITPFGIDMDAWAHKKTRCEAADHAPVVIGTVKSLKSVYGIDILLRAFAHLKIRQKLPVELRIFGGGPQEGELRRLSQELGIADAVTWGGALAHKDVPAAMASMDIFACFSRSESFGVVALEAMASGIPVVATRADGFLEVIQDGVSGLLGPIDDTQALAALLARLVLDPAKRLEMGRAGRLHVAEAYHWPDNVSLMEALYERARKARAKVV